MRTKHRRFKLLTPRNVLVGTAALVLVAESVSAQVQPDLNGAVINQALGNPVGSLNSDVPQWANVGAANGIYAQMRAGNDVLLRSELFISICQVALLIAAAMFAFRLIQWGMRSAEARVPIPTNAVELMVPIFLIILLANPLGEGFAMQTITLGTGDLLNSFQSYILTNGGKSTLAGGSAVRQATAKAESEQAINQAQVTCAATLDQAERKTCYLDAYESVSSSLEAYRLAQWSKDLTNYASTVLITEGANASQGANVVSAVGSVVGGVVKGGVDRAVNFGSGLLSPGVYGGLLLASSAFGITVGVLQMLMAMFFPLSVALSLAPAFAGSWIKWFTGMFQVWTSGLFLRMLTTILAIITTSGSSVSGGLYVVSATMIALVCMIMAIFSVISTTTGIAGNVSNNIISLR